MKVTVGDRSGCVSTKANVDEDRIGLPNVFRNLVGAVMPTRQSIEKKRSKQAMLRAAPPELRNSTLLASILTPRSL